MRVLISGGSGLVGTALTTSLRRDGHSAVWLLRKGPPGADGIRWNPLTGEFDRAGAEGFDAVVNLAGASIGEGRWTAERKLELRNSRVDLTRFLVGELSKLSRPPPVFVSASAIGIYGDRGEETLTEESQPGSDFLAGVAQEWETAAQQAQSAGMRAVILRFGVILSARGGALAKMLPIFRLGLGGKLGSGKQWMSWVSLSDVVGITRRALEDSSMRGTFNAASPSPVRNSDYTRTLGRVLGRPTLFPAPAFALRLMLGEMADALLLASQRVIPKHLQEAGFRFEDSDLESGLRSAISSR